MTMIRRMIILSLFLFVTLSCSGCSSLKVSNISDNYKCRKCGKVVEDVKSQDFHPLFGSTGHYKIHKLCGRCFRQQDIMNP